MFWAKRLCQACSLITRTFNRVCGVCTHKQILDKKTVHYWRVDQCIGENTECFAVHRLIDVTPIDTAFGRLIADDVAILGERAQYAHLFCDDGLSCSGFTAKNGEFNKLRRRDVLVDGRSGAPRRRDRSA